MFLLLIGYLVLAWAVGIALTFISRVPWEFEGRLAIGLPLGFSAAAFLTWLLAVPFGMSGWAVLAGAVAMAMGLALIGCIHWTDWRPRLERDVILAGLRWRRTEALPLALLLALAALFFIPFYGHALKQMPDGLYAGYFNIWSDWPAHLSVATYLSTAPQVLPPQSPWFAGTSLAYPFLPDFFSGILMHLGLDPQMALTLPSAILSLALVVVFYSTVVFLTGHRWAGLLAALVFFVGGGLGFIRIFGEAGTVSSDPLGWLGALFGLIARPPHEYTLDGTQSYWWLTPILAYVVPQRSTEFGWPLGLLALALLWHAWTTESRRETLLAGLLVGLMPLFHANTFVDFLVIGGGLALLSYRRWRTWLWYFIPALALGVPQSLMILPPAGYRHPFGGIQLGWMASTTGHHDNIVWFWIINTGLLIPLALLSFFPNRLSTPPLRRFLAPEWLLFLIPNIVVLQPWDFDNTKWLVWWAMPISILVGLALANVAARGRFLPAVAGLVVLLQVASGGLDLDRAWQEDLNLPALRVLDNDELAVGAWVRSETPPDSIWLTSWKFNHPVRVLGGRVQVISGLVSLWGTDIDYRERLQDVTAMFRGDLGTPELLHRYHVDYLVIGPSERQDAGARIDYYQGRFPLVYQSPGGEYMIFRISGGPL